MDIGSTIRYYLEYKGMTQKELAQNIDKSETAISQFINNEYNPSHPTLVKIAQALEIPLPVFIFQALEEDDIPVNKIETYKIVRPIVMALMETLIGDKEMPKELSMGGAFYGG